MDKLADTSLGKTDIGESRVEGPSVPQPVFIPDFSVPVVTEDRQQQAHPTTPPQSALAASLRESSCSGDREVKDEGEEVNNQKAPAKVRAPVVEPKVWEIPSWMFLHLADIFFTSRRGGFLLLTCNS